MARSRSIKLKGEAARMFINQAAVAAGREPPCKDTTQGVQDPATAVALNMEDEAIISMIREKYGKYFPHDHHRVAADEIIADIQARIERRRASR
jgi:hypothetical protein